MGLLDNKYNLSHQQSIYLAKKSMSANIYYAGQFENLNTTFPQTDTIVKGLSVSSVNVDEVQIIVNSPPLNALASCLKWGVVHFRYSLQN